MDSNEILCGFCQLPIHRDSDKLYFGTHMTHTQEGCVQALSAQVAELEQKRCHHGWRGSVPDEGAHIATPCPACGAKSLFIGKGGHLICSRVPTDHGNGCDNPSVERCVDELKAQVADLKRQLATAREDMKERCATACELTANTVIVDPVVFFLTPGERIIGKLVLFNQRTEGYVKKEQLINMAKILRSLPTDGEAG